MTDARPATGLMLGTVQFGVAYGVAGRGEAVPEDEVRSILELAAMGGITTLDTAPVYGDIEARLSRLCDGLPLTVVSKIPPLPRTSKAPDAVRAAVTQSRTRLGDRLTTLLFHRAEDLLCDDGDAVWQAGLDEAGEIRLGVSVYDPETLVRLRARYGMTVAQLPASPLDQRLRTAGIGEILVGMELHARSIFLQGLLLMSHAEVLARVPAAAAAHARWTAWCADHGIPPVAAALAITRALPGVSFCVVGVDRLGQLQQILDAARTGRRIDAPALSSDQPDIIDPRRWSAA